jgi:hypothetical protein
LFSLKTIWSPTRLETWRLRKGYAPARGGAGLLIPTRLTLNHQILGHSEVFKQWSCAGSHLPVTGEEDRSPRNSAKARAMKLLNENDKARQDARSWSGRLGDLAASSPAVRSEAAFDQPDAPLPLSTRLSSILNHLRQRARRRQDAAEKLRAQEFVMGP